MNKLVVLALLAAGFSLAAAAFAQTPGKGVSVVADEAHRRVRHHHRRQTLHLLYLAHFVEEARLYPLVDDDGITVTRGYPLEPRPGERVDHPHHAGLWFNYGDVNGFDFWNNSDAIKPEERGKMGTILHSRVVSTKSGPDQGELVVESVWVTGESKQILGQITHYTFARRPHVRVIDLAVTLTALDRAVFHDDKENGLVVLAGPPEGILKAVKAVQLIEQEAHMADLTQKVEAFLASGESN